MGDFMKWHFAGLNVLRENESGYEIHLDAGTWFHPKRLRPKAPEGMNFSTQITLLRKGLKHIKSIGGDIDDSGKTINISAA